MFDKLIKDSFSRFKLYYKNDELKINNLEQDIFNIYKKRDNNIYIMPNDNKYLTILGIIYNSIYYCLENLYKNDIDILDIVKEGDLVEYSRSICEFKGVEDNLIILKFSDGILKFPVKDRYKLSKYDGQAKKLKKMPIKSNRGTKKTKNLLAEILNVDSDELCKVNKKSILIIVNKSIIFEIMKNLYLSIGDNKVLFTEIFSTAYYSSVDNIYNFKGNFKKEESLIKFTSRTYSALDIIKKNKGINNVLYIPNKYTSEDLIDIVDLSLKKTIRGCSMITSPLSIEKYITYDIFNKDLFINYLDFGDNINSYEENQVNKNQFKYVKNFVKAKLEKVVVQDIKVSRIRKEVNTSIKNILLCFNDNEITNFIMQAREIIKLLCNLIIPLNQYNEIAGKILEKESSISYKLNKFNTLFEEIKNINFDNNTLKELSNIYCLVNKLYVLINKANPKYNRLNNILFFMPKNEKTTIIIENNSSKQITKQYFKNKFNNKYNIDFKNIKEVNNYVDNIIITSKLNENLYWNYRKLEGSKCIKIFYKFEEENYLYLKHRFERFIGRNLREDNNLYEIKNKLIDENINYYDSIKNEVEYENSIESEIEKLIAINYIPQSYKQISDNYSVSICERVITFVDGRKAFITKNYLANTINKYKEELEKKRCGELSIGDILIFIDDIDRDLVDENMYYLISNNEKFKKRFLNDYNKSKKWKSDLDSYRNNNNMTYADLAKEFKINGINRDKVTIRSWLTDSIVGPQDEEIYKAIYKILGYKTDDYIETFNSCNVIRSLQIRIRKMIVKNVLKISLSDDYDEFDKIIMNSISEDMKKINKIEIESIYDINKEIPTYIANKVIEV